MDDRDNVKQGPQAVMKDMVSHPPHYNMGKIEVIEAIEDWKLSYHRGNAVKYLARAGRKSSATTVEDLRKAIWYISREIELLEQVNPRKPNNMPIKVGIV